MTNEHDVEPDHVGQRQGTHGVVHPQAHDGVDGFGRADALLQGEDGLVDHRAQDAVGDEAREVLGFDRLLAHLAPDLDGGGQRVVGGARARMTSSSFISGTGLKKCIPMTFSGRCGGRGDAGERDGGGVGGQDGTRRGEAVEIVEELQFEVGVLGGRLDDEVRLARRLQIAADLDAQGRLLLRLGDEPLAASLSTDSSDGGAGRARGPPG